MADLLDAAYSEGYGNVEIRISRERELLGTAGAIRNALPHIESETALVLNGDSYCTADFDAFLACHQSSDSDRSMLLVHCDDCRDYGSVETDESGRVTAYLEKESKPTSGWVNAGAYLLGHTAVASIPTGAPVSIERDVFPSWISRGILGVKLDGGFLEAEDYLAQHGTRQ